MTSEIKERKKICLLPEALINKIAAGEVVERPASVVKELLENAVDAGATRIKVAVEDGGRTLIKVSDDGCGIPAEEAGLAFAQHATSKVASVEDLFAIATMGFRGEALASIASVSHAVMVTRTAAEEQGVRVEIREGSEGLGSRVSGGGALPLVMVPIGAPVGTTVEVRDLFYSVPARRKFLRTDATEFSHIFEMVLRAALPHAGVGFELWNNGKLVLELPASGDHRMRVGEALGKELTPELMGVDFEERGIRVRGFAGQPSLARGTAKYQYVFLNGRFIRDRAILHAVKEAYRGLVEPAAQPVAVLFLEMDPGMFDVNVHPQKTEVRFRDSGSVYRAVLAALREKLLASDLTPQVRTEGRFEGSEGLGSRVSGGEAEDTRRVIADFFRRPEVGVQPRLQYGVEGPSPLTEPSRITVGEGETRNSKLETRNEGGTLPANPEPELPGTASGRFVQLHNTYIVAETLEGVVIIDQHALHERIIYEEMYARVGRGALEGQRLLLPEVLAINPRQAAALELVKGLLVEMGMEITDFDAGSVAVHSFPSLLSKVSPQEFLRDLLDKLMEMGSRLTREELLHEVLDMASCKAAVKAGYPLSGDEIAALPARKEQVERSSNCPHGRPTTLRLTIGDLERQFKRK